MNGDAVWVALILGIAVVLVAGICCVFMSGAWRAIFRVDDRY